MSCMNTHSRSAAYRRCEDPDDGVSARVGDETETARGTVALHNEDVSSRHCSGKPSRKVEGGIGLLHLPSVREILIDVVRVGDGTR